MKPQPKKNRKNVGLELRKTHYTLGNDRIMLLYNIINLYSGTIFPNTIMITLATLLKDNTVLIWIQLLSGEHISN